MSQNYYRAYCFIASSISPYISADEVYKRYLDNPVLDWEVVAEIAGYHAIVQALYPNLQSKNLIQYLPEDFLTYIKSTYDVNHERNTLLKQQLLDVSAILNAEGIVPLLMKGAAHLYIDTFASLGERLLTDIDILVQTNELDRAQAVMQKQGYEFPSDDPEFHKQHIHLPPAIKLGECAAVEIHRDLLRRHHQQFFPTELAWQNCTEIKLDTNIEAKILTPGYRIMHSFLHDYITDSLYIRGFVELRSIQEFALSYQKFNSDIDWQTLFALTSANGISHMLSSYIHSTQKFIGLPDIDQKIPQYKLKTAYHHSRVCAKLKYSWFDAIDTKIAERIVNRLEKSAIRK